MCFRAHPHAGDPSGAALPDHEGAHPAVSPHLDGGFPPHRRCQGGLQHDAAGAQGHQVLVAGPVRRMLTEPVELVVLPGSARQHVRVDIRGLGAQYGAHGCEERVGLDRLRDPGPAPVEEVPVQILAGLPRVLLEQRDRMAPSAKHERRPQPADTSTDHRNPRH